MDAQAWRTRAGARVRVPTPRARDVLINVRVESAEARALGAERHVCELQLVLRPFAEIRSEPNPPGPHRSHSHPTPQTRSNGWKLMKTRGRGAGLLETR